MHMAYKNELGIDKIRYGEIHFYFPLKFETSLAFNELCDLIQKSSIIFTNEYQDKIMNSLGYSVTQIFKDIQKDFEPNHNMEVRMPNFDKYNSNTQVPFELKGDDINMEFECENSSFIMKFKSAELEALEQRIIRMHDEEEISQKIYGKNYTQLQKRFVLLPFKVKLISGEFAWLHAMLYVFANNMGFIKLEFPLINTGIIPLKNNNPDLFILQIVNKWNNRHYIPEKSISGIVQAYLNGLLEDTYIDFLRYGNELIYISLVDFDGQPKFINNVPKETQEDLFRIVAAPVPERQDTSYLKDAQEYLQKYSWGTHNINYIIKTTGGCFSFIDQTLLETVKEEYKKKLNVTCLDKSDYYFICNNLARDMHINVEFALIIIMLKKMNYCNDFYQKINTHNELVLIQKEYNRNTIFISELQENCYGSVSEQTYALEKMMGHFLKPEVTKLKLEAINNILQQDEKQKTVKFEKFLSIGGFLLAVVFGLPSIYDTIVILRRLCFWWAHDIPFITLENFSVFLWLVISSLILIKIKLKRINDFDMKKTNLVKLHFRLKK